jgi:hypothetical protein
VRAAGRRTIIGCRVGVSRRGRTATGAFLVGVVAHADDKIAGAVASVKGVGRGRAAP